MTYKGTLDPVISINIVSNVNRQLWFWQLFTLRVTFHLFVTCQNFVFGKYVDASVCLFVGLFVCLSVANAITQKIIDGSSSNLVRIRVLNSH